MKNLTTKDFTEALETEVRKIDNTIKVKTNLNRNELAKLKAQKNALLNFAQRVGYSESEFKKLMFGY